jgi:hypothetical protein
MILAALVGLMVLAFALRFERVRGPDGTMGEDQSRIALAAVGVLEHGYPRMPSGRTYYRGITTSYLIAGSIALFGKHDSSAKLPSVVLGTLLIPILFLLGSTVGGIAGGLSLAAFGVFQPDLLYWSTDAWMSLPFVVTFTFGTWLLYLGYVRDRPAFQVAGAATTLVTILTHELGVLLLPAVGGFLAVRAARGDRGWFRGNASRIALGILVLGGIVFVAAGLALRSGTLAGAAAEFRTYVGPAESSENFLLDAERFRGPYLPLVVAAVGGLFLMHRRDSAGGHFLYLTTGIVAVTVWLAITKASDRYGLVLVPLIALLAVWTIFQASARISARVRGAPRALGAIVLAACFALPIQRDARIVLAWSEEPPERTWLTEARALGWSAEDLVLSDNPSIEALYLGRVDYWARPEAYARYSFVDGDQLRDVYAGAIRIADDRDFAALVERHPGRRLWYFGEERKFDVRLGPAAQERLRQSADTLTQIGGTIILRAAIDRLRGGGPAAESADSSGT